MGSQSVRKEPWKAGLPGIIRNGHGSTVLQATDREPPGLPDACVCGGSERWRQVTTAVHLTRALPLAETYPRLHWPRWPLSPHLWCSPPQSRACTTTQRKSQILYSTASHHRSSTTRISTTPNRRPNQQAQRPAEMVASSLPLEGHVFIDTEAMQCRPIILEGAILDRCHHNV